MPADSLAPLEVPQDCLSLSLSHTAEFLSERLEAQAVQVNNLLDPTVGEAMRVFKYAHSGNLN